MQLEYKRQEAIACPSGYVCEPLIFIDPYRNGEAANDLRYVYTVVTQHLVCLDLAHRTVALSSCKCR